MLHMYNVGKHLLLCCVGYTQSHVVSQLSAVLEKAGDIKRLKCVRLHSKMAALGYGYILGK